jgi:hypothetical protein
VIEPTRDEYYQNRNSRLNTVIGNESELWTKIISARDEYEREHGQQHTQEYFHLWLVNTYGIELRFQEGMVSLNARIVDEGKYMLFLLRWG